MLDHHSRAPKQLGDFGEGLVTYALIRKGFEVATVDHVGADLIAEKHPWRIAVSVKTRRFRTPEDEKRAETHGANVDFDQIEKLEHFAKEFALKPVYAHIACIEQTRTIHMFMISVANVTCLRKVKGGYRLAFGVKHLEELKKQAFIDYSCWANESISMGDDFLLDANCTQTRPRETKA